MPKKPTARTTKGARTAPTLEHALEQLEALGNEATRKHNTKWGAGANQFGVKHGDIRALARTIGSAPELAASLWKTGNVDAQLLAILLFDPKALSADDVDGLVRSVGFAHVADWLHSNVIKPHADKETLRLIHEPTDGVPSSTRHPGCSTTAGVAPTPCTTSPRAAGC